MRLTTLFKTQAGSEGVWACTWVPGTSGLLTGGIDETVKLWDETPEGLKFQHTWEGQLLGVVGIATTADGRFAASSGLDANTRVFSLIEKERTVAVMDVGPMHDHVTISHLMTADERMILASDDLED